ncbi:MAG: T9SS type A sorting domain-containing protein [Saprospirales bacterium]|nr:T9SS type A sorting domain-containing protein [Saprospirales bacterium]
MKLRFTFLMVFCLMAFAASAQLVDVVTGVSNPWALALKDNDLYIGLDGSGGKVIKIDITQPNPAPVDVLTSLGYSGGLDIVGDELYIGLYQGNKVSKINLTQPNPVPVDVVSVAYPNGILIHNNYLYVSTDNDGIKKIDLAQPSNVVTYAKPANYSFCSGGLAIKNDVVYFTMINSISQSPGGLFKIDESQPNPAATLVLSGLDTPFGLTLNGNFLYVAEYTEVRKIDLGQEMPQAVTVVSGLNGGRLAAFDGLDMFITQYNSDKVSKLTIGQPEFSTQPSVCSNATSASLGGASPTGGVYSGPGVTNDGNGETFTFDPAAAGGPGTYTVTYTAINGQTATSSVTVVASPSLTSSSTPNTGANDGTATVNASGGTSPYTYAWSNGATTPTITGLANGTYNATVTDANGCEATASVVVALAVAGDDCAGAQDINALFGQPLNEPQTSGLWNNNGATATGDPAEGFECFFNSDGLQHTIWFTFTGDGNTYRIRSVQCDATDYINDGDTQAAIYTGGCSSLSPAACNDDEDAGNNILNISLDLATVEGTTYRMLIDGYGGVDGEFCLEVTNLTPSAVVEISGTGIEVFPNPTRGEIQLTNVQADEVRVYDNMGRLVLQVQKPGASMDISNAPAGLYFLKITEGEQVYSARIVKE